MIISLRWPIPGRTFLCGKCAPRPASIKAMRGKNGEERAGGYSVLRNGRQGWPGGKRRSGDQFCANTFTVWFVQQTEGDRDDPGIAGGDLVTEPDDQRLLRNLRAGRLEACAELVRDHYQAVYRFLAHLTRNVDQAEDLTQETFATAWQKIATFQGRASLATWLHRIAYAKFIDAHRAERRTAGMIERFTSPILAVADPLDTLIAGDEAQRLYQALHRLEAPERALLVLHYLQGLSYREMASVLDEPAGTVKWRTAEALNRLRAMLCDEVPDRASRKTSEPGPIC
jgi:RNA polymerase sigma-70 factor (ECF subfamily)